MHVTNASYAARDYEGIPLFFFAPSPAVSTFRRTHSLLPAGHVGVSSRSSTRSIGIMY